MDKMNRGDATSDRSRIEVLAYEIWEKEGRPEGRDRDHWQQAEKQLEVEFRVGYPDATGNEDPDSNLSSLGAPDGSDGGLSTAGLVKRSRPRR
jgi:hypothetical protein